MKILRHCIHIVKNGMRGLFFYCLFISACSANEQDLSVSAVTPAQQQLRVLPSYDSMKIIISNYKKLLFTEVTSHNYALIEQKFVSVIVDSIFLTGTELNRILTALRKHRRKELLHVATLLVRF